MQVLLYFLISEERDQGQGNNEKEFEDKLMKTITKSNFEKIEKAVTPRALQRCESNSLLMAMKVCTYSSETKF